MVINIIKKNLLNFFIIITIFTLDRLSKYFILKLSEPLGELNISITSFLDFNLLWNDGIAFGLLSFEQSLYYNVITLVIILVTLIIIIFAYKSKGLEKNCFLMIFGGSLGNIFDRLYYSSVIDFIDININNFHWFIFNVADMFIFFGVIMLLILELLKKNRI